MSTHIRKMFLLSLTGWMSVLLWATARPGLADDQVPAPAAETEARRQARTTLQTVMKAPGEITDLAPLRTGLLQALSQDPTYALPRYNLALLAESEEKWEDALKWYKEYCAQDEVLAHTAQARQAIARIESWLVLDKTPEGRRKLQYQKSLALASGLLQAGFVQSAIAHAGKAAAVDPKGWQAYAITAAALAERRVYQRAAPFFEKAIELAPEADKPAIREAQRQAENEKQGFELMRLGVASMTAKNFKVAAEAFGQAQQALPEKEEIGLALAIATAASGEKVKAAVQAYSLRKSRNPAIAKQARELCFKLSEAGVKIPLHPADQHNEKGLDLTQAQQWTQAETEFRKAVEFDPTFATVYVNWGMTLWKQSRWGEAETIYGKAVMLDPTSVQAYTGLASTFLSQKKWPQAIVAYTCAIRLEPANASHYDHLGIALFYAGQLEKAAGVIEHAVNIAPDTPVYAKHLAAIRSAIEKNVTK